MCEVCTTRFRREEEDFEEYDIISMRRSELL